MLRISSTTAWAAGADASFDAAFELGDVLLAVADRLLDQEVDAQVVRVGEFHREVAGVGQAAHAMICSVTCSASESSATAMSSMRLHLALATGGIYGRAHRRYCGNDFSRIASTRFRTLIVSGRA